MRKIKTRIKPHIAEALGLDVNPSGQYRVSEELYNKSVQLKAEEKIKKVTTVTKQNEYFTDGDGMPSAWNSDEGKFYTIQEYCGRYNIDFTSVSSYKLVSHNAGHMVYNIAMRAIHTQDEIDAFKELEKALKEVGKNVSYKQKEVGKNVNRIGVCTIADVHFGAMVHKGKINPAYSPEIVCRYFEQAAERVNRLGFDVVHVHLLGDLIESFTGLMHLNQWKELDIWGVKAVKMFVETIKRHFLDLVPNIGSIKIVGGNHDRVTSNKVEDTGAGVADLVAWGLELIGYDVEFSPDVLTHTVEDITYILNHGHHYLTKKLTTKEICWTYGVKGNFNFVCEGHLHSRIEKMTANRVQRIDRVQDDSNDSRRMVFPSFFTGNTYSENLGYSTTPGFVVTESNGNKKPIVYDFPL
jgi:hypothetical protein